MFDRFIRLARAKKALRERRFADALQLALDPVIRADRRAEQLRGQAVAPLLVRLRQHLQSGEIELARQGAAVLAAVPDLADVRQLVHDIDAAAAEAGSAQACVQADLATVRSLLSAGRLQEAQARLGGLPAGVESQTVRSLGLRIDEQRRQGAALLAAIDTAPNTPLQPALEQLARAELLDRDGPAVVACRARLLALAGPHLLANVHERLAAKDLPGALHFYRRLLATLPALQDEDAVRTVQQHLDEAVRIELVAAVDLSAALTIAAAVQASGMPLAAPSSAVVDALLAAAPWLAGTMPTRTVERATAAAALAAAAEAIGAQHLTAAAQQWLGRAAEQAERLTAARALLDGGDLDAARALLVAFVAEDPMHEVARSELELVDAGLEEIERRLAEARTSLRAGRLRHACSLGLAIAGSSRAVVAAQQLVVETRARMAVVERGLGEVRVALHGRSAATLEGVRHCQRRLEELAKVQAEVDALGLGDRLGVAMRDGAMDDVVQILGELLPMRARLLAPDRIDARLCDHADAMVRLVDAALAAGRLADVVRGAEAFAGFVGVRPEFATHVVRWQAAAATQRQQALDLVAAARERLAERELAEAERLVEQALALCRDCSEARVLAGELHRVRRQAEALERAGAMVRDGDLQGAHHKLASLPGASPLLRTRIYDMKQDLARAQGLEGAFLLRVDEGGEHLVWRGETMTIGNMRQRRADVPVLANLAGCHASIRRSMSFHGGMQDTVHAEDGDVLVAGAKVDRKPLASGDRVQLGSALGLAYRLPTSRSLTAALTVLGGFQVAGTDRLLLMKDRGRDGRVLLGPGADVHVRVARATGEVEVYANPAGQMRIACAAGGTIDGVPFRGEHPVAAGQVVLAAGISFVLLPWQRGG